MEEGTMVFHADSEGVDRRARSYIEELVWELILEQGLSPSAYDWKLVVDWEQEEDAA